MKKIWTIKKFENPRETLDWLVNRTTDFENYEDYRKYLEAHWYSWAMIVKDDIWNRDNLVLCCVKWDKRHIIVNWQISKPYHKDKHVWECVSLWNNVLMSMYNKSAKERNEFNASYYFNEKKLPFSNDGYTIIFKDWDVDFNKLEFFPDAILNIVLSPDNIHILINWKWTSVLYDKQKPDSFKIATIDNLWWTDHNTNWIHCDIIDDNHIFVEWKKYLTKLFFKSR